MPHVLIVNNCDSTRELIERLLTLDNKYSVEFESNPAAADAALHKTAAAAIVIDMAIDECNIIEFVDHIRKDHPFVPILLVSSKGHERAAFTALRKGASSYVPKDLLSEELVDTIDDLLEYSYQEHCHVRMLKQMVEVHCKFLLENDRGLVPPLVGYLQEHIGRSGVCDASDLTRIGIALDEALVNALYHGNLELSSDLREDGDEYQRLAAERINQEPYCDRRLLVEVTISQQVAEIMIRDDGPGFDPSSLPDPRDPANLEKVSGRGVLLMRTFMDEVEFNEKGNCVILRKYKKATTDSA